MAKIIHNNYIFRSIGNNIILIWKKGELKFVKQYSLLIEYQSI